MLGAPWGLCAVALRRQLLSTLDPLYFVKECSQ